MKKSSIPNEALLPIRFSLDLKRRQWISSYAWLHHKNQWYLLKYMTPSWLVRWWPGIMSVVPHQAWAVSEEEVLTNPDYIIPSDRPIPKPTNASAGTSGFTLAAGLALGPILSSMLYGAAKFLFPTNYEPNSWIDLLIQVLTVIVLFLIGRLTWPLWGPTYLIWLHAFVPPAPDVSSITARPATEIRVKLAWQQQGLGIYLNRLIAMTVTTAFWLVFLLLIPLYGQGSGGDVATQVFYGIILTFCTLGMWFLSESPVFRPSAGPIAAKVL